MNKDPIVTLSQLKKNLLLFMEHQRNKIINGYYFYSYSGDYYKEDHHWNLGASVFALKIYSILGIKDYQIINPIIEYILSFVKNNGMIYDSLINRKGFIPNLVYSIRVKQYHNLFNRNYKVADTRQSYSALDLFSKLPQLIWCKTPNTTRLIEKYLTSLDWSRPWGAGANFSHLMFFLNLGFKKSIISDENYCELTNYSIEWITNICHSDDGGWYKNKADLQQIINGSMKIITGLLRINRLNIPYPKQLIDSCLLSSKQKHACDNFNTIMTLCYSNQVLDGNYRYQEIEQYTLNRLKDYFEHYYPIIGGFSFYRNKANDIYYNARITKGLNEPDIHGTLMFLWGITLIAKILKIDKELKLCELIS